MADYYTCRGKGGTYVKLGISKGAGIRQNERLVVYQNALTGDVFHREIRDFEERMAKLDGAAVPAAGAEEKAQAFVHLHLGDPIGIDSEGGHCD